MSNRLALWCCKGLLVGPDRNEFYEVLGVSRRAETSEIKRAYRNKCLEVHPDKLRQRGIEITDEHRFRLQTIQRAGEVLADPQKRELYDQLGETGMKMIEDPSNISPDKVMNNFLNMKNRERLKLIMFVLLFVGAMLLFPILLCAKLNGELTSRWTIIWTPFWIYDALALYYFGYLVALGKIKPPEGLEEGWVDPAPLLPRVVNLIKWCIFIVQQIFLTLRLDDTISWYWAYVLVPLLFYLSINLFSSFLAAIQPIPKLEDENILEEGSSSESNLKRMAILASRNKARDNLRSNIMYLVQLVMILLQIDNVIDWDWWAVFWPVYLYFAITFWIHISHWLQSKAILSSISGDPDHFSAEDAMKVEVGKQMSAQAKTGMFFGSVMLFIVLLAVARIAGADFSTFYIFLPLFVASGCLVCCMSCFICCARGNIDDLNLDEEQPQVSTETQVSSGQVRPVYGTYGTSQTEEPQIPPPVFAAYTPPSVQPISAVEPPRVVAPITRIDSDID